MGNFFFTIDGLDFKLNVYKNIELSKKKGYEDHLFLPFSDLTCGTESYLGGKYIDLKIPKGIRLPSISIFPTTHIVLIIINILAPLFH